MRLHSSESPGFPFQTSVNLDLVFGPPMDLLNAMKLFAFAFACLDASLFHPLLEMKLFRHFSSVGEAFGNGF